MKRLAAISCALLCGACASTKPVATFQAPSLAPAEQAVARVEQHVSGAKDAARALAAATDEKAKLDKAWQDAYNQLNAELDKAYFQLQSAEDTIKAKDAEVQNVVSNANVQIASVAKDRDTQRAKADAEYKKKMFWLKGCFGASVIVLLLGAWTTKSLWLPAAAGLAGI